MLESYVRVVHNPYPHLFPASDGSGFGPLYPMLMSLITERADAIEEGYAQGVYKSDSAAFVLLDPTAPASTPSIEAVLAIFFVGVDGQAYLPNALAKACEHRDYGMSAGALVYSQVHRLSDGAFRFGHSAEIEGTYVGASGLSEIQDRYQAQLLAVGFNYIVAEARESWSKSHPDGRWFCNQNEPAERYTQFFRDLGMARVL